jgi:hypothetical protein
MMFKFLNCTNGNYADSQVFWSVSINGATPYHEEANMVVIASCIALFVSGAVFGALIARWHTGTGSVWGSLGASLLIAVIAAGNLYKAFVRSRHDVAGSSR